VTPAHKAALPLFAEHAIVQDGRQRGAALTAAADEEVIELAERTLGAFKDQVVVIAVGSYGREELSPHSDIDVLVLHRDEPSDELVEALSAFSTGTWGLGYREVGFVVRPLSTVAEQVRQEVDGHGTVTGWTNMLGPRCLFGDEDMLTQARRGVAALNREHYETFIRAKLEERAKRLEKPKNAREHLQPDIKEGYGGLRDFHFIRWLKAFADSLPEQVFQVRDWLLPEEYEEAETAYYALLGLRHRMHDLARREDDILTAAVQSRLAGDGGVEAIESLMQEVYKRQRVLGFYANVMAAAGENLNNADAHTTEADGFCVRGSYIAFTSGEIDDPVDMLRIYNIAQERDLRIHHTALRLIRRGVERIAEAVQNDAEANALFLSIMTGPRRTANILRQMQEIGLLQKFLPPFEAVAARLLFDPYHAYTVDEHIFRCIEHLPVSDNESEQRIRRAAALFHDLGKNGCGRPHELEGGRLLREYGPRLGLTGEETDAAAWLVENHRVLRDAARHLNPQHPGTVDGLIDRIETREQFERLKALTVADAQGTGPGRWGPIKQRRLDDLCDKMAPYFESALPADYEDGQTRIAVEPADDGSYATITVITPDRDFLLENLTGALAVSSCSVQEAEIDTETRGAAPVVVDTFTVIPGFEGGGFEDRHISGIEAALQEAAQANQPIDYTSRLPQPGRADRDLDPYPVKLLVQFDNAASNTATVVSIEDRARPGSLHRQVCALGGQGLRISFARVASLGHLARNTFYVTQRVENGKLPGNRCSVMKRAVEKTLCSGSG